MRKTHATHTPALLLAAALTAVSCTKGDGPDTLPQSSGEILVEACEQGMLPQTRSGLGLSENAVRNVTFALYDSATGILEKSVYVSGGPSATIGGLIRGRQYKIYALVNAGDRTATINGSCRSLSGLGSVVLSYGSAAELTSGGIPMASDAPASFTYSGQPSVSVPVRRLVAKYNVLLDGSLLSGGSVTVSAVHLRQMAASVRPFPSSEADRRASSVIDGDYATSTDLTAINGGQAVSFYALENRQGTLLSGNSDPWSKVPSGISARKDVCTYLEMTCSYSSDEKQCGNVTYRMYLGENATTNFDITRNTVYTLTFKPTDGALDKTSWKIDPGDVVTYGRRLTISPASATLHTGGVRTYSVKLHTDTYTNGVRTSTDSAGTAIANSSCTWTISSGSTRATVDAAGRITGVSAGAVSVKATWKTDSSVSATASVTVVDGGVEIDTGWSDGGTVNL